MKRIVLASILCCACCLSAVAQMASGTPPTKEDVEKLLAVTSSRDMITKMTDAMLKTLHQMTHEEYLKNQSRLPFDFEETTNERVDQMMRSMPWEEMVQAIVPVYQKHLTKEDIDALVVFYSSPIGKKMLQETPAIMAESMQIMMPMIQARTEKAGELIHLQVEAGLKNSQKNNSQSPTLQSSPSPVN